MVKIDQILFGNILIKNDFGKEKIKGEAATFPVSWGKLLKVEFKSMHALNRFRVGLQKNYRNLTGYKIMLALIIKEKKK